MTTVIHNDPDLEPQSDSDRVKQSIIEWERTKELAQRAIAAAQEAKKETQYYKTQNEILADQREKDEQRHRKDLLRIAELEAFVTNILEQYKSAETKLRLGQFRPVGTSVENGGKRPVNINKEFEATVARMADEIQTVYTAAQNKA